MCKIFANKTACSEGFVEKHFYADVKVKEPYHQHIVLYT